MIAVAVQMMTAYYIDGHNDYGHARLLQQEILLQKL